MAEHSKARKNSISQYIIAGRYKLGEIICATNRATLYKAFDLKDGRKRCLKQIEIAHKSKYLDENVVKEEEILCQLDSLYIVKYFELFLKNDKLLVVKEYCREGNLDDHLARLKQKGMGMSEEEIVSGMTQLLGALDYLHRNNIWHGNIKPNNIFVKHGVFKLDDYGISRLIYSTKRVNSALTEESNYTAPEVFEQAVFNPKSDVWSLGCVLFRMATGENPFEGHKIKDIKRVVCNENRPKLMISSSSELDTVLQKMVVKNLAERLSASELLDSRLFRTKQSNDRRKSHHHHNRLSVFYKFLTDGPKRKSI